MSNVIRKGNELIRIHPRDAKRIEYSKNGGASWSVRCTSPPGGGEFLSLTEKGSYILAITSNGSFLSSNGSSWRKG